MPNANDMRSASEAEGEEQHELRGPTTTVTVDDRLVAVPQRRATGAQIKRAALVMSGPGQQEYMLVERNAGGPDRVVADNALVELTENSRFFLMPIAVYMGAEGRYEDWVYLEMLQREWDRPVSDAEAAFRFSSSAPSPRSAIVILFWTYFETKVGRLVRTAMNDVPERLRDDVLQRYSGVGLRMEKLYRILFESTYLTDLRRLGYEDLAIHLQVVWRRRNEFAHGQPAAIDDELVAAVVRNLKREHEGWIATYNFRCANTGDANTNAGQRTATTSEGL